MKRCFYMFIAAIILLISANFIINHYHSWQQKVQPINIKGTLLNKPKNLPNFVLQQKSNQNFDDTNLLSKWSILYFGYTRCPDICPTALSDVTNLLNKLGGLSKTLEPIFITVDPKRDTPELLKNYLSFFDKRIVGLTGSQEQIEKVSNQYHVYYSYQNNDSDSNKYTVNHTANIYLLDKENNVEKIFIPGTPFTELYKYINRYLMKEVKNLPLK